MWVGPLKILMSEDPDTIHEWAKDALDHDLFRSDGTAQYVFAGEAKIHLMAYLPGIAWSMYHGWPARFGKLHVKGSVFVHPDYRHQGIGRYIGNKAWDAWKAKGNN